jgi:hypothetical protein
MDGLKLRPDPRLEPAPERTAFDYGLLIAKVGAIAFPFFGAGVTLFDLIATPLRGKRLNAWLEALRLRFNALSHKVDGLTPARLAEDDAFVSAWNQATQAALRTHQEEKLEALKNAVVNVALGHEPDVDRQTVFLSLVDRFTPAHLRLLKAFKETPFPAWYLGDFIGGADGTPYSARYGMTAMRRQNLLEWVREQASGFSAYEEPFIQALLTDLYNAGLTTIHPDFIHSEAGDTRGGTITAFGEYFLKFITNPLEDDSTRDESASR